MAQVNVVTYSDFVLFLSQPEDDSSSERVEVCTASIYSSKHVLCGEVHLTKCYLEYWFFNVQLK